MKGLSEDLLVQTDIRHLLTIGQAAARLHIHPNTLRRWTKTGKISAWRICSRGDRRIDEKVIKKLLDRAAQGGQDSGKALNAASRGADRK